MDRIHYARGSVLTGTAIARALLRYAESLAKNEDSSTIDIPTRNPDGSVGRAELLVGPASELISQSEESEYDEIDDAELVANLESLADRIAFSGRVTGDQIVRASPAEPGAIAPDLDLDLDLDLS